MSRFDRDHTGGAGGYGRRRTVSIRCHHLGPINLVLISENVPCTHPYANPPLDEDEDQPHSEMFHVATVDKIQTKILLVCVVSIHLLDLFFPL